MFDWKALCLLALYFAWSKPAILNLKVLAYPWIIASNFVDPLRVAFLNKILSSTYFSSLRGLIEKPPVCGKELHLLNSLQISGFRLHPGNYLALIFVSLFHWPKVLPGNHLCLRFISLFISQYFSIWTQWLSLKHC